MKSESEKIFTTCSAISKACDVSISIFILPYLVLHIVLSGNPARISDITNELLCVLQDQESNGNAEKRRLSNQVRAPIFNYSDDFFLSRAFTQVAKQSKNHADQETNSSEKRKISH